MKLRSSSFTFSLVMTESLGRCHEKIADGWRDCTENIFLDGWALVILQKSGPSKITIFGNEDTEELYHQQESAENLIDFRRATINTSCSRTLPLVVSQPGVLSTCVKSIDGEPCLAFHPSIDRRRNLPSYGEGALSSAFGTMSKRPNELVYKMDETGFGYKFLIWKIGLMWKSCSLNVENYRY